MKIAGLIKNDVVNGYDVCVSVWVQGCPFHCDGCHNPQTWSFGVGTEVDEDEFIEEVMAGICANNVQRNLSILGGEPLCEQNLGFVERLIKSARLKFPDIRIYIWTGYKYEDLNEKQMEVVRFSNVVVDGQFELANRDITLPFRGSTNQRIISVKESKDSVVTMENLIC